MWMMLVEKEARIIPSEAKRPPTIITGRQPKRFTSMLHKGPKRSTANSAFRHQKVLPKQSIAKYNLLTDLLNVKNCNTWIIGFLLIGTASIEFISQRPSHFDNDPQPFNDPSLPICPVTERCRSVKLRWGINTALQRSKIHLKGFREHSSCDHVLSQKSEHTRICVCESCAILCAGMPIYLRACAHLAQWHSLIRDCVCQPCPTNGRDATFDIAFQAVVNWTMRDPVNTFLEKIVQSNPEAR